MADAPVAVFVVIRIDVTPEHEVWKNNQSETVAEATEAIVELVTRSERTAYLHAIGCCISARNENREWDRGNYPDGGGGISSDEDGEWILEEPHLAKIKRELAWHQEVTWNADLVHSTWTVHEETLD